MSKKSKTPEKEQPKDPTSITVQAKFGYSNNELAELGRVAGREQGEVNRLESELASIKSDYKSKTESAEMRRDNAFRKLQDGFEMRDTESVVVYGEPKKGQKTLYTVDRESEGWKGEILRVEEMTKSDFQLELIAANPPVPFDSIKSINTPPVVVDADEPHITQPTTEDGFKE